MEKLPLVQEALTDSMPGCRLSELLRERFLSQLEPGAIANLVERMGKKKEFEEWFYAQPEFKQWMEIHGKVPGEMKAHHDQGVRQL